MARIRSIKPEFWTSEQVVECSVEARLLFIGLLNFCDDAGIHPASTKRLKMEVYPADDYRSTDIQRMIDELSKNQLIIEYKANNNKYWKVTGWEKHQRIDRPTYKHPKPPDENYPIQRAIDEASPPDRMGVEWSGIGMEGKGGDIGEEGNGMEGNGDLKDYNKPSARPPVNNNSPPKKTESKSGTTWNAYAAAYFERYGTDPVRNAKINSQLCQFVDRVGQNDAPHVASFYVRLNNEWYLTKMHSIDTLLTNAESITTQWKTNRTMTKNEARDLDRKQTNANVFGDLIREAEEQEALEINQEINQEKKING